MSETVTPHPGDSEEHVEDGEADRHPDDSVETIEEHETTRHPDEIADSLACASLHPKLRSAP